jgi:hypothetical protein
MLSSGSASVPNQAMWVSAFWSSGWQALDKLKDSIIKHPSGLVMDGRAA